MGQDNTYILLYREVRKVKDLFELYIKTRNKDIYILYPQRTDISNEF